MENKIIRQSWNWTASRYNSSVFEKRLLYQVLNAIQYYRNNPNCANIYQNLFNHMVVRFDVKDCLKDELDKNHAEIKKALVSITDKKIQYQVVEQEVEKFVVVVPFIAGTILDKKVVEISINPAVWDLLLDYSEHYSEYELNVAMKLSSVYSMRFYELISNQKNQKSLRFRIETLKKMFGVENKYKRADDFIKRVIKPAKEELDSCSPWSFEFEEYFAEENKRGRKRIEGITIYFKHQPQFEDAELKEISIRHKYKGVPFYDTTLKDYLIQNCGFDKDIIETDVIKTTIKRYLDCFTSIPACLEDVQRIRIDGQKAQGTRVGAGYIIKAMETHIKNYHNNNK